MDNGIFWILVFPMLLLAVLYYLGLLALGLGFIKSAFEVKNRRKSFGLLLIGGAVLLSPFAARAYGNYTANKKADKVQAELAAIERVSLKGRMPRQFIKVGNVNQQSIDFIQSNYRIRQVPDPEHERLATAYRNYRKAEFCHKYHGDKTLSPRVSIPMCRDLPASIQQALSIKKPLLILAEGAYVSLRRSNTFAGKMYEIRLITPTEDLLVDYYEQRTLDDPVSIINPYSSGLKRDPSAATVRYEVFVETALTRATQ